MKLWEVGNQNWELYIWKDLKTRETKGLSFSSEGKKKKGLQESKPQDYNSLFLHPHSWETPDLESNRSIIPQAVILMRRKAEANEKLLWRDRCSHIPKYHGIFTEKKKITSPANNEFTTKNVKALEWTIQPVQVCTHNKHYSRTSYIQREINRDVIKEIHIKWLKTRKEAIKS